MGGQLLPGITSCKQTPSGTRPGPHSCSSSPMFARGIRSRDGCGGVPSPSRASNPTPKAEGRFADPDPFPRGRRDWSLHQHDSQPQQRQHAHSHEAATVRHIEGRAQKKHTWPPRSVQRERVAIGPGCIATGKQIQVMQSVQYTCQSPLICIPRPVSRDSGSVRRSPSW